MSNTLHEEKYIFHIFVNWTVWSRKDFPAIFPSENVWNIYFEMVFPESVQILFVQMLICVRQF